MPTRSAVKGADALQETLGALGLGIEVLPPDFGRADLVVINPAGGRIFIEVKRLSLASADGLDRRIEQWNRQTSRDAAIGVLVADRVTSEAREWMGAAINKVRPGVGTDEVAAVWPQAAERGF